MLKAESITFGYHQQLFIEALNFTLAPGQYLWVSGANGIGKSTLLKIIVGLIQPHAGVIDWQGSPFQNPYRETFIYLGHQNALSQALTLSENLQLDWYREDTQDALLEAGIKALQLEPHLQLPVAYLSHGQQRKAALLRLWMRMVPLWVLDEPFEALDAISAAALEAHMQAHLLKGGMMVLVSHQTLGFLLERQVRVLL